MQREILTENVQRQKNLRGGSVKDHSEVLTLRHWKKFISVNYSRITNHMEGKKEVIGKPIKGVKEKRNKLS